MLPRPVEPAAWAQALAARQANGTLRSLQRCPEGFADFCSNDFLGLAATPIPTEDVPKDLPMGGSGSRLISGQYQLLEELESWAAQFFEAEAALYFPSGFAANLALGQALATRHDTLLLDERCHASLRDGARLSMARTHTFRHNDLADLERRLRPAHGQPYVFVESVYSMTGTHAPLRELVSLCAQYNACLLVDEAHGLGIYGPAGRGLLAELGLASHVPVRVYPLGKAAGAAGAIVAGSRTLIELLINAGRSLIYTTAPPPLQVWLALRQLKRMAAANAERADLWRFAQKAALHFGRDQSTPLLPLAPADGPDAWPRLLTACQDKRLWVRPIRRPTVPAGEECLRVTLHANTAQADLDRLLALPLTQLRFE